MKPKELIGSGDKILLLTFPFFAAGLALNVLFPSFFAVGGPSAALKTISIISLIPGVTIWLWSVALILTRATKGLLITTGPYRLVKHPIYTSVGLLVLPSLGLLLNTWLGALVGLVLYGGSRLFAPREEEALAKTFGPAWDAYVRKVKLPWL